MHKRQPGSLSSQFRAIEKTRLSGLLQVFLKLEQQRPQFKVLTHEKKLRWRHQSKRGELELDIRIDRVDCMDDGKLAVIDYKTGKTVSAADWQGARLVDMQLPVYFTASADGGLTEEIGAAMIAQIHAENCRYITGAAQSPHFHAVSSRNKAADDWQETTTNWQQQVHAIADEFVEGRATVEPVKRQVCQYCGLQPFCRIESNYHPAEDSPQAGDAK